MKIEVYSDIVCPWCYIGERRLTRALTAFAGQEPIDVVFKPYQLDPSTAVEAVPLPQYLQQRFAGRPVATMMENVAKAATAEGVTFNWETAQIANTRTAHRLMAWTEQHYGSGVQRELAEQLFKLYFSNSGNVGDVEELVAAGVVAGIDAERARAHLLSDEGMQELDQQFDAARAMGISAVPTFIIDGRYAVQGAQPVSTFVNALEEAFRTREELATVAETSNDESGTDGMCTDGSCTI